jgi:hypothetical protein
LFSLNTCVWVSNIFLSCGKLACACMNIPLVISYMKYYHLSVLFYHMLHPDGCICHWFCFIWIEIIAAKNAILFFFGVYIGWYSLSINLDIWEKEIHLCVVCYIFCVFRWVLFPSWNGSFSRDLEWIWYTCFGKARGLFIH